MTDGTSKAGRQLGGRPTVAVSLTREERLEVEALLRRAKVEKRVYLRARALLMMVDGVPSNRIAWTLNVHERTAEKWRRRFREGAPIAMLADAHRTGRPRALSRKPTARA
jgi:Winged helix-turn helix